DRTGSRPWEAQRAEVPWASGVSQPLFSHSEDGHTSGAGIGYSREHLPEIRRALRGKHGLCQAGLKELLQKELPTWTPMGLREGVYSEFMSVLDTDKDRKVDFVEYVRSLACLCTFCHDYFKDVTPVTPCSQ
ncbi:protein S100-A3-like, partial [Prionailurus bengalensis]|uniref:protein S100-A3-like n=1 Tax=Prionailurus bengalensis TaxID=37029 RepID=UPI001CA8EDAC